MSRSTITQISSSQATDAVEEDSSGKLSNNKKPTISLNSHLCLSLCLLVLAGFGVYASILYENNIANFWTQASKNEVPTYDEKKNLKNLEASPVKDRLLSQLLIIENREKKYSAMTKVYYQWLFVTIMSFSTSTIIASVCLFYISKEGWKKANNYVINVFTVFSSIALLSGSLRLVLKLEDNAQKNLTLLTSYIDLKNKTLTSIATIKTSITIDGKQMTISNIVNQTEKELSKYNDISIIVDTNNLPNSQKIIEGLPKPTP
ncbi:hypothetical protein HUN01_09490 [Nostoc edaphicum CCNP1411]|uniref:Uncharacterized protein n=1 Tax=Nostoc edaphicum CCNP1411 TaxID=1472755 RepID=A0A7D7QRE4_9NOSO|nr:hypothetical protein [Nostoc edaphicum]QMS87803.1 hypothetical protein HUN01_09490 [Nostoc edaphicum CCNP1411]